MKLYMKGWADNDKITINPNKAFEIYVPGEPIAKARPRITRIGTTYTPPKTVQHERKIKEEWFNSYGRDFIPSDKAIAITVRFFLKKPERLPKEFPETPQKRPDIDNLVKTVLDALNGVAYQDDKQIVKINAFKNWSSREQGYTIITVYEEG